MKIAVIDDYQDAFRNMKCAAKLQGHEIVSYTRSERDPAKFAARLADCEVLVMTQQRTFLTRAMIERFPVSLKMISQTGKGAVHIDLAACTERGIIVSASGGGNSGATAELTWALILASVRNIPTEVRNME